jgi:hypothetical protein
MAGVAGFNVSRTMDTTAIPNATALKAKDSVLLTFVFMDFFLSFGFIYEHAYFIGLLVQLSPSERAILVRKEYTT